MNSKNSHHDCEFTANLNLIREIPHFSGMDLESQKLIAYLVRRMKYHAGDLIFEQENSLTQAFYILEGEAELVRVSSDGREIMAAAMGSGDFVGGMALLSPVELIYSLRAKTDMLCIVFEQSKIKRQLIEKMEVRSRYYQAILKSISQWEEKFFDSLDPRMLDEISGLGVSVL